MICESDEESANEVFVLLGGELAVTTKDGVRVATVIPVTTVGEIALIARQRRSATVHAVKASRILVIPRPQFDLLMRRDKDLQISIYRNVIEILFTKLTNDNVRMRDHLLDKVRRQTRVKEARRRVEIAIGLLEEKGVMNRDEAKAYIDTQAGELSIQVLIVDDEPAIRTIVKEALPDFEVVEAGDGEEALERIKGASPIWWWQTSRCHRWTVVPCSPTSASNTRKCRCWGCPAWWTSMRSRITPSTDSSRSRSSWRSSSSWWRRHW